MNESVLDEALFRHSFLVSVLLGTLCRFLVLRIKDKQYPTRPQDYIEQIIMAGLTSALGGIALPALMDKEFSALTFLAVGIQQFQGLSKQEKITLNNIDEDELVKKGATYIDEIASTYEVRSYVSLFAGLGSSIAYVIIAMRFGENIIICTVAAILVAAIVGLIFRRILRRNSINDIADIKEAKIYFDGPIMKVNDVVITNIGLKATREKFLKDGIAIEVVPKDEKDFGVINDLGQRDAIIYNIFIHTGVDKDVDEHDIVSTSKVDLKTKSVLIVFMPILNDMELIKQVAGSTPILEAAKGKQSNYQCLIK